MRRPILYAIFAIIVGWPVTPAVSRQDPGKRPPQAWALVIGIEDYPKAKETLGQGEVWKGVCPNAVSDAKAVARWLTETARWPAKQVRLMTSDQRESRLKPTRANLKDAVETWLRANVGQEDLVLIYYAGQAIGLATRDYLLPMDYDPGVDLDKVGWLLDDSLDSLADVKADMLCCLDTSISGRGNLKPWGKASSSSRLLERIAAWPHRAAWIAADGEIAHGTLDGQPGSPFRIRLLNELGDSPDGPGLQDSLNRVKVAGGPTRVKDVGVVDPRLSLWPGKIAKGGDRVVRPVLQRGHSDAITGLFVSKSHEIVSSSRDSTARIWKLDDGPSVRPELLRTLAEPISGVSCLAESPDGRWIVAGSSESSQYWLWNHRGESEPVSEAGNIKGWATSGIHSVGFLPGSNLFVVANHKGQAQTVDLRSRKALSWLDDAHDLCRVAFAGSSKSVGAAAFDRQGDVRLLGKNGQPRDPIKGLGRKTTNLDLADDGRLVVVGTSEGSYALIDLSGSPKRTIEAQLPGSDRVKALRLHNAQWLAIGGRKRLVVIRPDKPAEPAVLNLECSEVSRLEFSEDGRFLGAIIGDGDTAKVRLWGLPTANQSLEEIPLEALPKGIDATRLAFSNQKRAFVVGFNDGSIRSWSLDETKAPIVASRPRTTPADPSRIRSIAVSPDGKRFVVICQDDSAFLFDFEGRSSTRLPYSWNSLGFLPDGEKGRLIGLLTDGPDLTLEFRNLWIGRPVEIDLERETMTIVDAGFRLPRDRQAKDLGLERMQISADGRWIAAVRGQEREKREVFVWDIQKKGVPEEPDIEVSLPIEAIALTSFEKRILISTAEEVTLYSPEKKHSLQIEDLRGDHDNDGFTAVAIRPDACKNGEPGWIAVGTRRNGVVLWDPSKPDQPVRRLEGKLRDGVATLRFSHDGRWLIGSGAEKRFLVWDLKSEKPELVAMSPANSGHEGEIRSIEAWPGLAMIATAGDDCTVRFWSLDRRTHLGTIAFTRSGQPDDPLASLNWVAFTPSGRFDCTMASMELVKLNQKGQLIQLSQAAGALFKPGLIAEIASNGVVEPPPQEGPIPPSLALSTPDLDALAELKANIPVSKERAISIEVKSDVPGVKHLRLYRNNRPIKGDGDFDGPAEGTQFRTRVSLEAGENVFRAVAARGDEIEGSSGFLKVIYEGTEKPSRVHVLAIGVEDYEKKELKLRFAVRDAKEIAEWLHELDVRENGKDDAAPVIPPLLNHQVDVASVSAALKTLKANVEGHPADKVVVFIAGHTEEQRDRFGLLPSKSGARAADVIPYSLILEKLGQVDARHRLVIVDGCQTDKILADPEVRALVSREVQVFDKNTLMYPTQYILASKKGEPALEIEELKHGLLTYTLLRGLGRGDLPPTSKLAPEQARLFDQPADSNHDGKITTTELNAYAASHLPLLTAAYPSDGAGVRGRIIPDAAPLPRLRRTRKADQVSLDRYEPPFELVRLPRQ